MRFAVQSNWAAIASSGPPADPPCPLALVSQHRGWEEGDRKGGERQKGSRTRLEVGVSSTPISYPSSSILLPGFIWICTSKIDGSGLFRTNLLQRRHPRMPPSGLGPQCAGEGLRLLSNLQDRATAGDGRIYKN